MPLGASLTAKHRQKPLTVTIQLGLPDTADIQHLRGRLRSIHQHLLQRLVMENDIRRHVVLARDRLPARAQRFPQTEIFVGNDLLPGRLPRCHDDAFRVFAEKQWRLSTQDTTTGFCQDQRTVTGCIRSQVPGNDQLVAVVLGAAIAGGAAKAILLALLTSGESTSWLSLIINIAFYPFVIPAVLVGVYLRVLMQRGEEQARDFTAAEAEENWIKVAPHLLALWALCWMAVSLLTWLQSVPSAELGVFGRTSGVTTSFIICVWMLLPIANSHDAETLFKSAFESGITAAVSIFTIKLSLFLTNLVTNTGAVYAVVRSPGARLTQHHGIAQLSIRCSCRAGKSRLIRP